MLNLKTQLMHTFCAIFRHIFFFVCFSKTVGTAYGLSYTNGCLDRWLKTAGRHSRSTKPSIIGLITTQSTHSFCIFIFIFIYFIYLFFPPKNFGGKFFIYISPRNTGMLNQGISLDKSIFGFKRLKKNS